MASKLDCVVSDVEDYIVIEPRSSSNSSHPIAYPPFPLHLPPFPPNSTSESIKSQTSCNICPIESHRVISKEENPTEIDGMVVDLPKKPYSKNLKQAKQFWLGEKLKASWAFIKSLLRKSGCSNKLCASAANKEGLVCSDKLCASAANKEGSAKKSTCNDFHKEYVEDEDENKGSFQYFDNDMNQGPCVVIKTINNEMIEYNFINYCRRSFSRVVRRRCASKASSLSTSSSRSSSLSFNSIGSVHKRIVTADYGNESSI